MVNNRKKGCVGESRQYIPEKPGALTICMENPEISGRIQMERFIPAEIFRKKSNTFRGFTFFPKRPKFSVPFGICADYPCHASCREKQLNPVPVFGAKKIPVPFDGNFSMKFPPAKGTFRIFLSRLKDDNRDLKIRRRRRKGKRHKNNRFN